MVAKMGQKRPEGPLLCHFLAVLLLLRHGPENPTLWARNLLKCPENGENGEKWQNTTFGPLSPLVSGREAGQRPALPKMTVYKMKNRYFGGKEDFSRLISDPRDILRKLAKMSQKR